jgi:hypothetical protein
MWPKEESKMKRGSATLKQVMEAIMQGASAQTSDDGRSKNRKEQKKQLKGQYFWSLEETFKRILAVTL